MTGGMAASLDDVTQEKKGSKTWIIVLIVILALCCVCVVGLAVIWLVFVPIIREYGWLSLLLAV